MDADSMAFGSLTLLMVLGSAVMIWGVAAGVDAAVGAGGVLLVAGILLMARQIAVLDEPEGADEAGH